VSATSLAVSRPLLRSATAAVRAPARATAAAVLLVALLALIATHHDPRLAVPRKTAVADIQSDPTAKPILKPGTFTRIVVLREDAIADQVLVYQGPRLIYRALVNTHGQVGAGTDMRKQGASAGSDIAKNPLVLGMLAALFVLMSGVWPLWRMRNLDVLAVSALTGTVVLFDDMFLSRMVLLAYPLLMYLAARCAWYALGRRRAAAASTPMFERLTAGWTLAQQRRILRLLAFACAMIIAMVGLSSLHLIDVSYAVMEGATAITHGLLPYGHIADIVHGDTYPFGSYLFYAPLAWLTPVNDVWGDADFTLVVAVLAAVFVAWRLARSTAPAQTPPLDGLRTAVAWLAFPPLIVTVSTGTTDVVLGAMLLAAIVLWRRPTASTALLALSAWFKLVPLALLPFGLARLRGRALRGSLIACVAISVLLSGLMIALGGVHGMTQMLSAMTFQDTRRSAEALWTWIGSVPLQPLAQAATLALIAGATVRLGLDRELAADRTRIAALCAAVLLGIQISANYWSFMYSAWVVPLLMLSTAEAVER